MATAKMAKVLALAHSKAARKKAAATQAAIAEARRQMAARYGESPTAFMKPRLIATIKRHNIPPSEIPEKLLKPFPKTIRKQIMSRGNGHDNGVGIPLDAIPERAPKKTPSPDPYKYKRGHPNAELIGKILDLLASPQIDDRIAERLLAALDKLT